MTPQEYQDQIKKSIYSCYSNADELSKGGQGSGRKKTASGLVKDYLEQTKKKLSSMDNRTIIEKKRYHELAMQDYDNEQSADYIHHKEHFNLYKKELDKRTK